MPQPFEIWYVSFRFLDNPDKAKKRPALVLDWDEASGVALMPKITGNIWRTEPGYVVLKDWCGEGLTKPSAVRCSQILEIERGDFLSNMPFGRLSIYDATRVIDAIGMLYPKGIVPVTDDEDLRHQKNT